MSSHLFLMLSPIFLIPFLLLLLIKPRNKIVEARRLPPGPKKLPFIGNLHQLGDLPHRSLEHLSNEYGPLMFLKLGSVPTLVVSSADMAREIFKEHDRVFSGRPVLYAAKKFSYNCSTMSFAPYGGYWREVKKIAMTELLSAKRVQSFDAVREEEVTLMVDFIAHSSSPVNLSELALLLSNNVVCRAAFSRKSDEKGENGKNKFDEILHETQDLLGGFCVADFFPWMGWFNKFSGLEERVEKNFNKLDRFYDKVLEEHLDPKRPKPEHEDLVDVLLRVQKDPSQVIRLNDEQIKAVITDMFIAGTDTSSATLVWIMTEVIRNPSVMRKAQEEVRDAVKGKGKVEESDISKLVYLNLVIKETLRLHPPVPLLVPRETTESCTIRGYEIPAKTRVFFNAKSIATDPKCWENPNEFRPERFLNSSIDFKGQNFELLPFGAGRRGCPGINFSLVLIELALTNLLYHFDWKLPQGMNLEDIDMEEAFGLTMHKKTPLCLVATPIPVYM
ncbi:cytochrome P450 71A9-like [Cornus florida]|uniref:cytochrome P450 71A9-like n=1 Tax=Cornus florida TaxID=4283 RepID=UPI0028968089|nr:cytochrome P450 71A9-like [Cornus florida]